MRSDAYGSWRGRDGGSNAWQTMRVGVSRGATQVIHVGELAEVRRVPDARSARRVSPGASLPRAEPRAISGARAWLEAVRRVRDARRAPGASWTTADAARRRPTVGAVRRRSSRSGGGDTPLRSRHRRYRRRV